MRVFKVMWTDGQGRRRKSRNWTAEARDGNGRVLRATGFTDRAATERLGQRMGELIACRAAGLAPDADLQRWIAGLPGRLKERFGKLGLLDAARLAAARPLAEHIADWTAHLAAKGDTAGHVKLARSRVLAVIRGTKARALADLTVGRVTAWLAERRAASAGFGRTTSNHYGRAVKGFLAWMVGERRASENPLAGLRSMNTAEDLRHRRRALTIEEIGRLMAAAKRGPARFGLSGLDRAMLYRLAVETGLRAGELRSLTPGSFDLAGPAPSVVVAAGYSKHRREDTLPLRRDTARALRDFLAGRSEGEPVFAWPAWLRPIKFFKRDLADAGIVNRDDSGRVADFHALRHTFITRLAASGVHPKVAQGLARHSTIGLTMDLYTGRLLGSERAAVEALPATVPENDAARLRKTGTDDVAPTEGPSHLARHIAREGDFRRISPDLNERKRNLSASGDTDEKPALNAHTAANSGPEGWRGRRDSNPQRPDRQSGIPPGGPRAQVPGITSTYEKRAGAEGEPLSAPHSAPDGPDAATGPIDADLEAIKTAWPALPKAVRKALADLATGSTRRI